MGDMMVFDCETTGINPYDSDASLLTFQYKINNNPIDILAIWDYNDDEAELIQKIIYVFQSLDDYSDLITYNGLFDIQYMMGRTVMASDVHDVSRLYQAIQDKRFHHDLMKLYMYENNGFPLTLNKLCARKLGIKPESSYVGREMPKLYLVKRYEEILKHAEDDVKMTYELAKTRREIKVLQRKNKIILQ